MQDPDCTKPADLTTEDHNWRDCGCKECDDIRYDIYLSRGE